MTAAWTTETVLALAPDPASARAGQGLASARKWASLGTGEGLVWGECQGSGATPYQTQVDLAGPAFSCSCPSRKFPCKHALGLLMILATTPDALTTAALPAWVAAWKAGREKKAEQSRAKSSSTRGPAVADPAAQAKRESARRAKVAAGLDDLSLWMADLVRQGFAALAAKPPQLWENQARRMIDAQAPGVARRLRQIDAMSRAGETWQADLLDRLARLHLLGEGYRRAAELPAEVAADIRATIGFPVDLDAVRAGPGVRDHWQVIGMARTVEDRLTVRRTWLVGRESLRPALLLDFAAGGQPLETGLTPGTVVDQELAFFPGAVPLRALVKETFGPPQPLPSLAGGATIADAFAAYGAALAKNPWLELSPIILQEVVLREDGGAWQARDAHGAVVPFSTRFDEVGWNLLAITGSAPLTLCGEFDGATFEPLGCHLGDRYLPLGTLDPEQRQTTATASAIPLELVREATACAVVGIDRRTPPALPADDPVGRTLSALTTNEPSARLLAIAAAANLYGRVGRKPVIDPTPPPPVCPADDRPECLAEPAARLWRMLAGEHRTCLGEWIGLLAASGRTLPHSALVTILSDHGPLDLPEGALSDVLGVRGRWLAAQNPKWQKHAANVPAQDPALTWETGAPHERLAVLNRLRATDPAQGRALVVSTFASEPAPKRAAFLAVFAHGLSMEDEPFLETALDDRGKDVRSQAALLLRSLPGSRLCLRMGDRARAALGWNRASFGPGRGRLAVEPPVACDKAMIRDGVEPKPPPHLMLGERAWWLREVIAAVPVNAIAGILGATAAEIVEASRGSEWEAMLRSAWTLSTRRHHDADWAEPLLEAHVAAPLPLGHDTREYDLLPILPAERQEAFLLRQLRAERGPLRPSHPAFALVEGLREPVGLAAAHEILLRIRPILAEERAEFADPARRAATLKRSGSLFDHRYHDQPTLGLIQRLPILLPLALVDEVAELAGGGDDESEALPYARAYAGVLDALRFRRDMHQEFSR